MNTATEKQTKWAIDPTHSEVQFKVKHLMISTVTGHFKDFDATVETEGDSLENAKVYFEADAASITTNQAQRDEHLRSDDFFNAEKHPKITFESRELEKVGDDRFKLRGDLTIREHTRPVELDVEYNGIMQDPYGNTKSGFEVTGKINRKDFGLKWNGMTEAGGVVVSDEVKLAMNVQFTKQEA